jgi:hypothetical protein
VPGEYARRKVAVRYDLSEGWYASDERTANICLLLGTAKRTMRSSAADARDLQVRRINKPQNVTTQNSAAVTVTRRFRVENVIAASAIARPPNAAHVKNETRINAVFKLLMNIQYFPSDD